jgi:hypothetical protein
MEQALDEACAASPASEADTGELIHVEQMLEIATDAAKQAIVLRRRRREATKPSGARAAMGDAEAAASAGATHRVLTDARGVRWDVFAVYPEPRPSPHSQLKGTFQQGWLCYDSGTEKRRLSPIPENWQSFSDEELERLAHRAEVGGRRGGRAGKDSTRDAPNRTDS